MKISLSGGLNHDGNKAAGYKILEQDISACKRGDWEAKKRLARTFGPLIHSLAEKRAKDDRAEMNRLTERGKEGLILAARKYKQSVGAKHFKVFALDYIEKAMDAKAPRNWLGRLFRR